VVIEPRRKEQWPMNDEKEIASHGGHGWAKYALKSLWCYSLKKERTRFFILLAAALPEQPATKVSG
jgi:hypothetical protein